jgi:NAD(P)-dependent dehydrogenase (short-subunit alcohol dehydrogenase family)
MSEMKGKVCVVTGSNSGIGKETALALAKMDALVVMVVRNRERGEKARAEIVGQSGSKSVDIMICDLASMDSIRHFAREFKGRYGRLDVLINNAGAVFNRREVTNEGFERTLAVNYLGPFLLTHELTALLKSSAPSRVINLSSGLHKSGKIDFDDLQSEKKYGGMKVYASAKLMVIMFTYELARRLEGTGVSVNVVEPGFVATNLGRNTGSLRSAIMFKMVRPMQISAKKGAETSVYLASSYEVKNVTGKCFTKMHETATASISYDQKLQEQLWNKTMELLGLSSD